MDQNRNSDTDPVVCANLVYGLEVESLWKKMWKSLLNLKIHMPFTPKLLTNSLLRIYPKGRPMHGWNDAYIRFVAKNLL